MNDQDSDEIAKLASFTGHLKHAALLRGDDLDEAYLAGITEGLMFAHLLLDARSQFMTRWAHFLADQQIRSQASGKTTGPIEPAHTGDGREVMIAPIAAAAGEAALQA